MERARLTKDLRRLVEEGAITIAQATSLLETSPVLAGVTDPSPPLYMATLPTPQSGSEVGGSPSTLMATIMNLPPPPTYEASVVDEAFDEIQTIRDNPTTAVDILYGKDLPLYLKTLKKCLNAKNLEAIESSLKESIQQCFTAVNDHARVVESSDGRQVKDATDFAIELVELTKPITLAGDIINPVSMVGRILGVLDAWQASGWLSDICYNGAKILLVRHDQVEKETKHSTLPFPPASFLKPTPPPLVLLLSTYVKTQQSTRIRGSSTSKLERGKRSSMPPPKPIMDIIDKMSRLLVDEYQKQIAVMLLSQWRALNENKTILFSSPAPSVRPLHSSSSVSSTRLDKTGEDDTEVAPVDGPSQDETVTEDRTFRGMPHRQSLLSTPVLKRLLGREGAGEIGNTKARSLHKKSQSVPSMLPETAPSRIRVHKAEANKGGAWYALRPPDSTNVLFKTLGPKGANAAIQAGASLFAVNVPDPLHKSIWNLECNVLSGQQVFWEFHAFPPTQVDFELSFSPNADEKREIFPPTVASMAPTEGSLQRAEGGTYTFTWSSRAAFGVTDVWCVVRCPAKGDQEARRHYVRASRPIQIGHPFAPLVTLAGIQGQAVQNRAGFSANATKVRMFKKFLGNEMITGESPVLLEFQGKFLSVAAAPKLQFLATRVDDAAEFYVRGIHPQQELEMGMQFELATTTKEGNTFRVCSVIESGELYLHLVPSPLADDEGRPFEQAHPCTFYASAPIDGQHIAKSVPALAAEKTSRRRRVSLGVDLTMPVGAWSWQRTAGALGILPQDRPVSEDNDGNAFTGDVFEVDESTEMRWTSLPANEQLDSVFRYITEGSGIDVDPSERPEEAERWRIGTVLLSSAILSHELQFNLEGLLDALLEKLPDHSDWLSSEKIRKGLTGVTRFRPSSVALGIVEDVYSGEEGQRGKLVSPTESILIWQDKLQALAKQFSVYDEAFYQRFCHALTMVPTSPVCSEEGKQPVNLKSTNVEDVLERDRRVRIAWLQSAVLQEETPQIRATAIEIVICLALESRAENNYKMVLCCFLALESKPILRLLKTWGFVRGKFHAEWSMLKVLCNEYGNFRTLRRTMSKKETFVPCYLPLQKALLHVAILPTLILPGTEDRRVDVNWHKLELFHESFVQQGFVRYEGLLLPKSEVKSSAQRRPSSTQCTGSATTTVSQSPSALSPPEIHFDVHALFSCSPIDEDILLQRSEAIEGTLVGKNVLSEAMTLDQLVLKALNIRLPKSKVPGVPYRGKRAFVGAADDDDGQTMVDIVVEDAISQVHPDLGIDAFHSNISEAFKRQASSEELLKHTCAIIESIWPRILEENEPRMWHSEDRHRISLALKIKRSVRTYILGHVGMRVWAAVRRDAFPKDNYHNNCVREMSCMTDEELWALCADTPYVSNWQTAIRALDNVQVAHSPASKMHFLRATFVAINEESRMLELKPLTADDLIPILLFVVCKSKCKTKYASLRFADAFLGSDSDLGDVNSGFDRFVRANIEMALTIADQYPNFFRTSSTVSRASSSISIGSEDDETATENNP